MKKLFPSTSPGRSLAQYLNEQRLWCLMVRQVTNAQEDEDVPGINNEWNLVYEGGLNCYRSLLVLREAFLD